MPDARPARRLLFAAALFLLAGASPARGAGSPGAGSPGAGSPGVDERHRFAAVADRPLRVAFLLSEGATLIDFAGPWEVFQDVMVDASGKPVRTMAQLGAGSTARHPFTLFTVAERREPMRVSGGLTVVPDHTFADAPTPDVIVVGAQRPSDAGLAWLKGASATAGITLSVCTGASVLARAGLLDGQRAATHYWFTEEFGKRWPKVTFVPGARFVESGRVASSAGLSAGIDLALRVVERYLGREVAQGTADFMEYQGEGWKQPPGPPLPTPSGAPASPSGPVRSGPARP
jgi:transcriptional regulator GlxA family with amidase domain